MARRAYRLARTTASHDRRAPPRPNISPQFQRVRNESPTRRTSARLIEGRPHQLGFGQTTHTNDGGPFYEGNYPAIHSLADTVAALRAQKIRVFSFTAGSTGGSCGRSNNSLIGWARYPASHIPRGWSEPYNDRPPIPTATDGKNFSLSDVQKGTRSLADTINEVVLDSYCNPIIL